MSQTGADFWFVTQQQSWKTHVQQFIIQTLQPCIVSRFSVWSWTSVCFIFLKRVRVWIVWSFYCISVFMNSIINKFTLLKRWLVSVKSRKWCSIMVKMIFPQGRNSWICLFVMSSNTSQNFTCDSFFSWLSARSSSWTISNKTIVSQYSLCVSLCLSQLSNPRQLFLC